jgi:nanoRNase/pAp phosphatase (c-di-AMP/oligoRNAs hydrolase)
MARFNTPMAASKRRQKGGDGSARAVNRTRWGIVSKLPLKVKLRLLARLARGRKRGLILTHDNPDPDSLASAVALAFLFEQTAGVPCDIGYGGIVGRAENTAMIRVLHLPATPVSRVVFLDYDLIAMVDTQPPAGNHSLPPRFCPDVVIDHHPAREGTRKVAFADVGHTGATCSILVEYLRAAGLEPSTEVATALFYGIKADTRDLGRQTYPIDVASYVYLMPEVDKDALSQIEHPALPARYFRLYDQAIKRARVFENAVEVDLGEVYTPDMVAEVAERLLALEGMRWSLAYGGYSGQLFLSIRTNDRRVNAGRLIREICDDLGGSSGGHGSMAGARLPLHGSPAKRRKLKHDLVRRFLAEFGVKSRTGRRLLELDAD